ncbi:MAG: 3-isopropylmalate dehydratase small subunit [Hyphomicrobiales bacterium]|nr:3-isopropylmalate dehydratase small subunit [Hyphomicrobiales bacterium]
MTPFTTLRAIACPLPLANIDTDQLVPARFLKQPRAEGYGGFLLHDLRFGADGKGASAMALDDKRYQGASILVARRNFGGGSSREGAVYALLDFGIRCVIAPSFGDIFASNCVMNGLLPACVNEIDAEALLAHLQEFPGAAILVDLETQWIVCGNKTCTFSIDSFLKTKLLNGWDDVDVTKSFAKAMSSFLLKDAAARPWARPTLPAARRQQARPGDSPSPDHPSAARET